MKEPIKRMKRDNSLRKNYFISVELGLIFSLTVFILLFKMDFYPQQVEESVFFEVQEEVFVEEIVQTKQTDTPPPPPRPPVPIEVPNDEIIADDIVELDLEFDLDGPMDLPPPPPKQAVEEEFEDEIFVVVEQPPELIGGIAGVQKRIVYPELALKVGIEGRVVVQFVVDKEGTVVNPVVMRGIGGGCDEEAIRAVKLAKFQPGMQRGRPVAVRYSLPITFKIYNKDS
ncbi:MAG: energy transducer TonB [Balneolaceae bacterium]|nr:energy transducer TonB [Balneolaceae bacterium]